MSDERRERYAAAMSRTNEWDWPTEDAYRDMADAAMVVADEEFAAVHVTTAAIYESVRRLTEENDRLRAALEGETDD